MEEIVEAPIAGKVVSVEVGNSVEEGAVICVIEAMKMENPILALVGESIKEVAVSPDQTIPTGSKIAVIEH